MRREWLVIESSAKNMVFGEALDPKAKEISGYIPRDAVVGLGIRVDDGPTWFTAEEGKLMRAHPEWRTSPPQ